MLTLKLIGEIIEFIATEWQTSIVKKKKVCTALIERWFVYEDKQNKEDGEVFKSVNTPSGVNCGQMAVSKLTPPVSYVPEGKINETLAPINAEQLRPNWSQSTQGLFLRTINNNARIFQCIVLTEKK